MITFYRFMLWCSELELALAMSVPVRNPKAIAACQQDISRWELALLRVTI